MKFSANTENTCKAWVGKDNSYCTYHLDFNSLTVWSKLMLPLLAAMNVNKIRSFLRKPKMILRAVIKPFHKNARGGKQPSVWQSVLLFEQLTVLVFPQQSVSRVYREPGCRARLFASQRQHGKKQKKILWKNVHRRDSESQHSQTKRVWTDLREAATPFLILTQGKSIGHLYSALRRTHLNLSVQIKVQRHRAVGLCKHMCSISRVLSALSSYKKQSPPIWSGVKHRDTLLSKQ